MAETIVIDKKTTTQDVKGFFGKIKNWFTNATSDTKYQVAEDIFENLVQDTPVLTGWARASWVASVNRPKARNLPRPGKGSLLPPPEFDAPHRVDGNVKYIIANDAPHISRLNAGWSPKARAGFIERAIDRGTTSGMSISRQFWR